MKSIMRMAHESRREEARGTFASLRSSVALVPKLERGNERQHLELLCKHTMAWAFVGRGPQDIVVACAGNAHFSQGNAHFSASGGHFAGRKTLRSPQNGLRAPEVALHLAKNDHL